MTLIYIYICWLYEIWLLIEVPIFIFASEGGRVNATVRSQVLCDKEYFILSLTFCYFYFINLPGFEIKCLTQITYASPYHRWNVICINSSLSVDKLQIKCFWMNWHFPFKIFLVIYIWMIGCHASTQSF